MVAEGAVVRQVRVMLMESVELEVLVGSDEVNGGCVCAGETRTFQWDVRATSMGTKRAGDGVGEPRHCLKPSSLSPLF